MQLNKHAILEFGKLTVYNIICLLGVVLGLGGFFLSETMKFLPGK